MGAFDPTPSYRVAQPGENAAFALSQPLSPMRNLWEQTQQGALDSFGLGSAIKDFMTPRGVPGGVNPIELGLEASPITSGIVGGYESLRSMFGTPTTGAPMSQDDWKTSPYFRKDIPWDAGMTTDRAAALATQFDIRQARTYFGQKDMLTTLAGGFLGGALDPLNYVPVFGPVARTAAAAKFGYVVGHGLIGASEAAINTAVFGALTAPDRARYGEDVSWQATINNIAFSAIAGGIFGGLGGLAGRAASVRALRAEQALRMETETVSNLVQTRGVLSDAIASYLDTGDVRASPASKTVIERMASEVQDRQVAARALDDETAGVTGTKAGEVVISPSGARVAVRPEVVELSSLQRATGALQVRDRSAGNVASATQVEDIAINLDPVRLMPNVDASQGAPLVGADNVVDSGNGRVAAIARAYEAYPDKAAAYRKALVEAGHPEAADMQTPVLVQRRVTPLSDAARAQFNADVNSPTTQRMSAVELAAMDRGALTDQVLAAHNPDAPVMAASNRGFVARFLGNLPSNERLGLVDPDGNLNADGVRRIENAMIAAAYGDVDATALRKFAEATDDNTRSIVGALSDVAGKWLGVRRAIERGEIGAEFDQTPELTEALRAISRWRDQAAREKRPVGVVIREGMGQGDLLTGSTLPAPTKLFIRAFYAADDFAQAAGRDTIAARLNDVVNATMEAGRPDMLGEAYAATKLGVLHHAFDDIETDVLETTRLGTGTDGLGQARGQSRLGADQQGDRGRTGENAGGGSPAAVAAQTADLKRRQPARSLDELYAVAPQHQAALDAFGKGVADEGAEWKNPGVKKQATSAEKMARKGYDSTSQLTDVVRGGFVVKSPQDADRVMAALRTRFGEVVDEGWQITEAGYFDRKALIRFDDGTVGEVQFWHPDMLEAKGSEGHKLYSEMRGLAADDPKFLELLDRQKELYLSAVAKSTDDWLPVLSRLVADMEGGRPASGNASSKAASDNLTPESITSAGSADRQSPPASPLNQAELPLITAGRDSQSKNVSFIGGNVGRPTIDMQEPKPEPPPDGLEAAAARVGKSEDIRALAEQFGVDAKTGDFVESADIDQLREQGRLTVEDEAELAAAQNLRNDAAAYSEVLRKAAACVVG